MAQETPALWKLGLEPGFAAAGLVAGVGFYREASWEQPVIGEAAVGTSVLAYCDPKDPKLCALELGDDGSGLSTVAVACFPAFARFATAFAPLGGLSPEACR